MRDVIYFELNNWFSGRSYPADDPFISWMRACPYPKFCDTNWVVENKLCVVMNMVDMSLNFCITASKEWVEKNCPKLLTDYKKFLREPDKHGHAYGNFGNKFLTYEVCNIGITDGEDC